MFDANTFANSFADFAKAANGIPELSFHNNNSLSIIVKKLMLNSNIDYTTLTQEEAAIKFANTFNDALGKLDDNSRGEIDTLIKTFAGRITSSVQLISEIGSQAEEIANKIEKIRETHLAVNPYPSIHLKRTDADLNIQMISWDDINLVSSESTLVDNLHEKNRINTAPSRLTLNIVKNKLPLVIDQNSLVTLNLTEDSYTRCLNTLNTLFSKSSDITDIPSVLVALTNAKAATDFCRKITLLGDTTAAKDADNCVALLAMIRNAAPIIDGVLQGIIELSEEHQNVLMKNAKTLWSYLEYAAYYTVVCRRVIYVNSIMLPNEMINPDTKDEFISGGGSMLMVYHHRHYVYPKGIPNTGITAKAVLEMSSKIIQRVTEDVRNIDTRILAIDNDAKSNAFMHVMEQYAIGVINSDSNKGQKFTDYKPLLARYRSNYVTNSVGLVDCIYGFIIDQQYKDTFTEVVYYALGAAYARNLKANIDITNEDTSLIEIGVFSNLVTQFCVEKFIR